jgi:hypothetical protein
MLSAVPGTASAATVVVLGAHGRATVRNDRFITTPALTPAPLSATPAVRATIAKRGRRPVDRNVRTELARLRRIGAISAADYGRYLASFNGALATVHHLRGIRATELEGVIENLHMIAADRQLTPSRLPALFLTLDRNRQWWTTGPLLVAGQRVEFTGSELVWEYYPGQGIELQELGSFGKADGLYTAGPLQYARLHNLLAELIPLAATRAGGIAWEYYFQFDGGLPPWTSAMSQATAIEALTRASNAFNDRSYLAIAQRALTIFSASPPLGVDLGARHGSWYLLYSFAPGATVVNGFLQSLVGLYDYAQASGNQTAARLFATGNAEAEAAVPRYDTGAWSLYQPGQEDTLSYHELVTGFLQDLCDRVHAAVYCTTAADFQSDLKTAPALALLTSRVRAGAAASVRFRLSKVSHVGIVIDDNGRTAFSTSANFGYGTDAFAIPALHRPGTYSVRLAATDLAGNFNRIDGTLQVSR